MQLADVKGAAPQLRLSSTSQPTQERVETEIIPEVEAEVNATLKAIGYELPIDPTASPQAMVLLKALVLDGVIARTIRSRDYGVRDPESGSSGAAQREFNRKLAALKDPEDPYGLPDAVGAMVFPKFNQGVLESQVQGLQLDVEDVPITRDRIF